MDIDASVVSPSETPLPWPVHDKGPLHLAIVVTLVLTALLIYSLRAFTRGKLLRSFAIDDGLMVLAALCTLGIFITFTRVVELGLGQQHDGYTLPAGKTVQMGPWIWALNSFNIFGLGLVKLSATFTLLPLADTRCHSYLLIGRAILLIGIILLVFWHTLEWFISILAHCVPLVAAWDLSYDNKASCMSQSESQNWALANYLINAASSLLLVLLTLPIVLGSSLKFGAKLHLLVVVVLGLFACTAAIIRSRMVVTSWADIGYRNNYDLSFITWGIVEFITAMIAINLSTLLHLSRAIRSPADAPCNAPRLAAISGPVAGSTVFITHGDVDDFMPNYPDSHASNSDNSYNSLYSDQTGIYRPEIAYFPSHSNNSLARFHSDESNLDLDIEAPSIRSGPRRPTKPGLSSRFSMSTVSTRRMSDWSQLSGFSYLTHTDSNADDAKEKSRRVSAQELEELVKSKRQSSRWIGDKEVDLSEKKTQHEGIIVAPRIFLVGEEDAVNDAGEVCTCPAQEARKEAETNEEDGDTDDANLQSEADSSEITVIRILGSPICAFHKEEDNAQSSSSRISSPEWVAQV